MLFGLSWLLIGRWLGFPLDMPFGVNLVQWQDSADIARQAYSSPGAFVEGLQPTLVWLGPGLVALGLIGVALRGALLVCRWQIRRADLLIGVASVLVLGYVNKTAGWFPKYEVALAPLLASLGAPVLVRAWHQAEDLRRTRLLSAIGIVSVVATATLTLSLIRDEWALQRTWAIETPGAAWLAALIVASVLVGIVWRLPAAAASIAIAGLAVGWSIGVDVVQVRAPYQTDYWYGTTGTLAAAEWLDAHLSPNDTYVGAKEVAIRSHAQRYVDQETIAYFLSAGRPFAATWAGEPVRALVLWQREPYVADLFTRAMPAAGFSEAERFGDYVIYVPTAS
jgi:hypothetical protein